jgi:hypothetical protein
MNGLDNGAKNYELSGAVSSTTATRAGPFSSGSGGSVDGAHAGGRGDQLFLHDRQWGGENAGGGGRPFVAATTPASPNCG